MTFLQGNLNRCRAADFLLDQLVQETRASVVFVSEQFRRRDSPTYFEDNLGTAALWILDTDTDTVAIESHGAGEGYVFATGKGLTYVSCYLTPNEGIARYRQQLERLEDAIRDMAGSFIVAGDFNARAQEWGMPQTDTRGRLLCEMASRLGLLVLNVGNTPTYRRPGFGESIPDVTLASEELVSRIEGWKVMGAYTGSDHEYISFRLVDETRASVPRFRRTPGWNLRRMDLEGLKEVLQVGCESLPPWDLQLPDRAEVETVVESSMEVIRQACDSAMPRRPLGNRRRQVYWWTDQITALRRTCLQLRRRAQRSRTRPDANIWSERHKAAKKELVKAIRTSKWRCWQELREDLDRDPWGKGYKLVIRKLNPQGGRGPTDPDVLSNIVDALFPTHPLRIDPPADLRVEEVPEFSLEELQRAAGSMKKGKAPGPDGIPSEILKLVVDTCPDLLLRMYNACLKAGVFPARWKQAKLVLLNKGKGGHPDEPSSYRPLCMLDTAGKLMEKLIKPRLQQAIRDRGDLSARQFGFREGRSTINAIAEVIEAVRVAEQSCHAARPIVLLVTLDVKNAFNSARWVDFVDALERTFSVPGYLLALVRDYLRDRTLTYDTDRGQRSRPVTSGAAQGSVLGPDLWNVSYDSLLRLQMPLTAFLVGYADDVAAVITSATPELAQLTLNQVMRRVNAWMADHGLQLAISKTEIVMLTRKRIPTVIPMAVGAEVVTTRRSAKYLGVTLDCKLTFRDHIQKVCERASAVTSSLSRLLANLGGPRSSKRRLLLSTAQSIMLYGAEVWGDATKVRRSAIRLLAVQRRGALRVASAYRTVSEPAVLVITGTTPIDLLAQERKYVHDLRVELDKVEAEELARTRTLGVWQQRWEEDHRGRWTARLIGELGPWLDRRHGEVNFYLTQFLSGHGYFRAYLSRMGKVASPACAYCGEEPDDAFHTFFVCGRFGRRRDSLAAEIGGFTPECVVAKMVRSEGNWRAVAQYVQHVLTRKREEGCLT